MAVRTFSRLLSTSHAHLLCLQGSCRTGCAGPTRSPRSPSPRSRTEGWGGGAPAGGISNADSRSRNYLRARSSSRETRPHRDCHIVDCHIGHVNVEYQGKKQITGLLRWKQRGLLLSPKAQPKPSAPPPSRPTVGSSKVDVANLANRMHQDHPCVLTYLVLSGVVKPTSTAVKSTANTLQLKPTWHPKVLSADIKSHHLLQELTACACLSRAFGTPRMTRQRSRLSLPCAVLLGLVALHTAGAESNRASAFMRVP